MYGIDACQQECRTGTYGDHATTGPVTKTTRPICSSPLGLPAWGSLLHPAENMGEHAWCFKRRKAGHIIRFCTFYTKIRLRSAWGRARKQTGLHPKVVSRTPGFQRGSPNPFSMPSHASRPDVFSSSSIYAAHQLSSSPGCVTIYSTEARVLPVDILKWIHMPVRVKASQKRSTLNPRRLCSTIM